MTVISKPILHPKSSTSPQSNLPPNLPPHKTPPTFLAIPVPFSQLLSLNPTLPTHLPPRKPPHHLHNLNAQRPPQQILPHQSLRKFLEVFSPHVMFLRLLIFVTISTAAISFVFSWQRRSGTRENRTTQPSQYPRPPGPPRD
jgi:hypothetical protein